MTDSLKCVVDASVGIKKFIIEPLTPKVDQLFGHWQGHGQQTFPEELLPLRLFKCRMWLWLVIPGLYDAESTKLSRSQIHSR
jgi:hypothetical protein